MSELIGYGASGKPSIYTDKLAIQPLKLGINQSFYIAMSLTSTGGTYTTLQFPTVPVNEVWIVEHIGVFVSGTSYTSLEVQQYVPFTVLLDIRSAFGYAMNQWHNFPVKWVMLPGSYLRVVGYLVSSGGTVYSRPKFRVIYT